MLPLRPANLGEILDRTANLYRGRFLVFLAIAGIPSLIFLSFFVALVLLGVMLRNEPDRNAANVVLGLASFGMVLVEIPVCLAAYALGEAALTWAANQAYLGERPTIRGAYKAGWKRGWRNIGLYSLKSLAVWLGPAIVWTLCAVSLTVWAAATGSKTSDTGGDALLAVTVILTAVGLWMLSRLCLAFPVSICEDAKVGAALKRSWRLSGGARWRVLVVFVLRLCLGWVCALLLAAVPLVALSLLPHVDTPQHQQTLGMIVVMVLYGALFLGQAMAKPVSGIAMVVFCYDQRIRREAFDIEWMMQRAGLVEATRASAAGVPWMPPAPSAAGTARRVAEEPLQARVEHAPEPAAGAETHASAEMPQEHAGETLG